MELKYFSTTLFAGARRLLIAPLMELKYRHKQCKSCSSFTFNRTAYGIEIYTPSAGGESKKNF